MAENEGKNGLIQQYVELCRSYGVDVQVALSHGDSGTQKVEGTTITLNEDRIPKPNPFIIQNMGRLTYCTM